MGSSKETPQVTTQTSDPWGPSQPYIKDILGEANRLYVNDVGYKPWSAPVLASLNPTSKQALSTTATLARQPVAGLAEAQNFAKGMIGNNGMTSDLNTVAGYLKPFADGSMQEDPRLKSVIENERNDALNGAFTRMGGGRYGSAGMGAGFSKAASAATDQLMLQSNENARNRQLQASGLLGNLYESGLGRAAQATSMLPTLDNLKYAGAERLAGVGDFYQNRQQANRDGRIARYEALQARPWEQLSRWNAITTGAGQLGGTQTGIKPTQRASTAQRAIGGAASGAALGSSFGPWGTAIGAGAGGLLGAFG